MTPLYEASLDLGSIIGAEHRPSTLVTLPVSARTVSIQVLLRRNVRHPDPIPRAGSCWAPNKPSLDFEGEPLWPEYVLVRLLERAGWEARWIKNWTGGREFCVGVDQPRALPPDAARTFNQIHDRAIALRGSGSWDIYAWRGQERLFIESKQHRSSDRLNDNQRGWLEAALDVGIRAESFAVVEYDAGKPIRLTSNGATGPLVQRARRGGSL